MIWTGVIGVWMGINVMICKIKLMEYGQNNLMELGILKC